MQQNRLARYKTKLPTTAADDSPRAIVAGRLRADSERADRSDTTERFDRLERGERSDGRKRPAYQQPSSAARSAASRPASGDGRRLTNMLVTLAAVLVIICFIMSAGLIQNEGRISTLENSLNELTSAYNSFQLMVSRQLTESVFAGTSDDSESVARITPTPPPGQTQTTPSFAPAASPTTSPSPSPSPSATPEPANTDTGADAGAETEDTTAGLETGGTDPLAAEIPETYVVEPGDTLSYIAFRFYGDNAMIAAILAENDMADANMLQAGQEIKLPQRRVSE
jgi:LysM repeat protein